MNLFVVKQITLLGLYVTATDALAIGYLFGFNIFQEIFGKKEVTKALFISLFLSLSFGLLSLFQLAYHASPLDAYSPVFIHLLLPYLRVFIASLLTFLIVQLFDITLFSLLRRKTGGRFLTLRVMLSLTLATFLDTTLFTLLGLFGLMEGLLQIAIFSIFVKLSAIFFYSLFAFFIKKVKFYETLSI